jgi:hypothetical protein
VVVKTAVATGHLEMAKALVLRHASLVTAQKTAQTAIHALHTETATTVVLVQSARHTEIVTTAHLVVTLVTAIHAHRTETVTTAHPVVTSEIAIHALRTATATIAHVLVVQMTVVVATAQLSETVMTVAHVVTLVTVAHVVTLVIATIARLQACQTDHGKTAANHAVTLLLAMTVAHVAISLKTVTRTAQTVQPVMTHASQPSVVHATATQIRRLSSRMLFLSV